MTNINDGGPAFPMPTDPLGMGRELGMSLRAWFVGMTLSGMVSRELDQKNLKIEARIRAAVEIAFGVADAALKKLKKD